MKNLMIITLGVLAGMFCVMNVDSVGLLCQLEKFLYVRFQLSYALM
jgi:hypothetical protein